MMTTSEGFCGSCGREMLKGAAYCTYCGEKKAQEREIQVRRPGEVTFEVRKIGIGSLMKLSFVSFAVMGLISGLMIMTIWMSGFGMVELPMFMEERPLPGTTPWLIILIITPLVYGFFGAIFGLISGSVYNFLAWGVGGIRITLSGSGE